MIRNFHWDLIQGTEEWLSVRAGKITGSVVKSLLVNGRGENGFGAGAITHLYRCVEERLSGAPRQSFSTKATEWGHEFEALALLEFERRNFLDVKACGFISYGSVGSSPDGLIPYSSIGVEAKCLPTKHIQIIETGIPDEAHVEQSLFNLWVSGYKEWRLIYFHPLLPSSANYCEFLIKPDHDKFAVFKERTEMFEKMIQQRLNKYKK